MFSTNETHSLVSALLCSTEEIHSLLKLWRDKTLDMKYLAFLLVIGGTSAFSVPPKHDYSPATGQTYDSKNCVEIKEVIQVDRCKTETVREVKFFFLDTFFKSTICQSKLSVSVHDESDDELPKGNV